MAATDARETALLSALASAGGALLTGLPNQAQAAELDRWQVDAAALTYLEGDGRVTVFEPAIQAQRTGDNDSVLNLKFVWNTLSGASPNGATPADEAQTFSRPSGNDSYTVDANEQPLDSTFKDMRTSGSMDRSAPINRDWTYGTGVYASTETDYTSIGLNGSLGRYLNNKNTTLSLGVNLSIDRVSPIGGAPDGLTTTLCAQAKDTTARASGFSSTSESENEDGEGDDWPGENKLVGDLVFGVTQIINRRTLMQFNYSLSASGGYLNDPYKVVSVIDDSAGSHYGGVYHQNGDGVYLYEQRPDRRLKQAFYTQVKHQTGGGDILDLSYRYLFDDWGMESHTVEGHYRWRLGHHYLEPQARWYTQTAADFYHRYLTSSEYTTVDLASADYRLGRMDAYTLGLQYGYHFTPKRSVYARLSVYQQISDGDPGIGLLADQELYPDLTATLFTLGLRF